MGVTSIDDLPLQVRRTILKVNYYDLLTYADIAVDPRSVRLLRDAAEKVHVRYAAVCRELGVEDDLVEYGS